MNVPERIRKLKRETERVYVCDAGKYGKTVYKRLIRQGIQIDGFVVTRINEDSLSDIPIVQLTEIIDKNVGIILSLREGVSKDQVLAYLEMYNFNMEHIVDVGYFLDNRYVSRLAPGLDITTNIGCTVDCKFCPQSLLLSKYFEKDKFRTHMMSVETFQICIDKLPEDGIIVFGGMAEPFLNPNCLDMLKIAVNSGKNVELYTTLEKTDMGIVKQLVDLPLDFVNIHVADRKGYAKINNKSEEYYQKLEYVLNSFKADGITPFVTACSSQTLPDIRIQELCSRVEINLHWDMSDRAGALNDDALSSSEYKSGKLRCRTSNNTLLRNVLLPDGTVLSCHMDYGMRHIFGNLLEQSYDEIANGTEISMIREGLNGNEMNDILCRKCVYCLYAETIE